jgi:hypothetical protein
LLAAGSTGFPIGCLSRQSLENAPKGVENDNDSCAQTSNPGSLRT